MNIISSMAFSFLIKGREIDFFFFFPIPRARLTFLLGLHFLLSSLGVKWLGGESHSCPELCASPGVGGGQTIHLNGRFIVLHVKSLKKN